MHSLLPLRAVLAHRGGRTTKLYDDIDSELFTPPVKRGRNSFWPASEVAALVASEIAGRSDDEIRELVKRLLEQRKHADAAFRVAPVPPRRHAPAEEVRP
jgi:prophage regulatory protein